MNRFLFACKKRPLGLWIAFFAWLVISVVFFCFMMIAKPSPFAFIAFYFLLFPTLQLFLFVKPLTRRDAAQIVCMYLIVVNSVCSIIWLEIPTWIFVTLHGVLGAFWIFLLIREWNAVCNLTEPKETETTAVNSL